MSSGEAHPGGPAPVILLVYGPFHSLFKAQCCQVGKAPERRAVITLEIQGAASQETRFEYTGRVSFDKWEEILKQRDDVRGKVKKASSTNTTSFPPLPHASSAFGEAVAPFAIAEERFRRAALDVLCVGPRIRRPRF